VDAFVNRIDAGESLAVDQLLNAIFVLAGEDTPHGASRQELLQMLLQDLASG
jgi:hypothetical protein